MFGPVITTEPHLAFSGRTHSNNSAEMSAMTEALSFLGEHAAGVCLGTIQARTCPAGTTLIPQLVLVLATTLETSWKIS